MLILSHKNLEVYKISLQLVKSIYVITKVFPKEEIYGLTAQIRRAAVSVCSNIAEGAARKSKKEKLRFYEIARSSVVEIDTQMELATILNYHQNEQSKDLEQQMESTFRMLSKMISNLETNPTHH